MKCPYCNFELTLGNKTVSDKQVAVCRNPECKYAGWHLPAELWQELIRTRKALETIRKEMSNEYMPDYAVIRDALKTALEQKD